MWVCGVEVPTEGVFTNSACLLGLRKQISLIRLRLLSALLGCYTLLLTATSCSRRLASLGRRLSQGSSHRLRRRLIPVRIEYSPRGPDTQVFWFRHPQFVTSKHIKKFALSQQKPGLSRVIIFGITQSKRPKSESQNCVNAVFALTQKLTLGLSSFHRTKFKRQKLCKKLIFVVCEITGEAIRF